MTDDLRGEQIVEYACREGFRAIVTERMVTDAIAGLTKPFTCREVTDAIPRDAEGYTVSEYLVALWIEDLCVRGQIRWTGARCPRTYEVAP